MDNRRALFKTFLGSVPETFSFLTQNHGFTLIHGFARYQKGRVIIVPAPEKLDQVTPDLLALCRFESDAHIIEIAYCETDYRVHVSVIYNRTYRFDLNDLKYLLLPSKAVQMSAHKLDTPQTSPTELIKTIDKLRQLIQSDIDLYLNPPDDFLKEALSHKSAMMGKRLNGNQKTEQEVACRQALEAFEQGDYKRAIALYRPFKSQLSKEDLRIFSIALMRLDE